jgi:hypothetical protein
MRTILASASILALLLVPAALAHGLPGVPVRSGPLPPVPRTSSGAALDQLFAPEATVALQAFAPGSGPAWQSAPTTEYDLRFECPPVATRDTGLPAEPGQDAPTACPAYVLDAEDILAQPDLAVDGRDNLQVAFHALHGGPGLATPLKDQPPSPWSRDNAVHQTHTTFQSRDGGSDWDDNRYYAPADLSSSNAEVYGEDNAMELDDQGRITLASLYSARTEAGDEPHYAVYLWSSDRIKTTMDYSKAYVSRGVPAGLRADSLDLAWSAGAKEMVAAWRTTGPDGPRVHVEHGAGGQWAAWGDDRAARVGPCDVLSNLASVGDRVLFACAQGSDTRLWALEPDLNVTDLGLAPVHAMTSLRLASAEGLRDGGIVLGGAAAREGRSVVVLVWGVAGADWSRPAEVGPSVTQVGQHGGAQLVDARMTALAVKASSGTAHFLVQEQYAGGQAADARIFGKAYGVMQSTGRFLGTFALGYGDPQSRANVPATIGGTDPAAFHDAHDSFAVVRGKTGEERLFVAFGDYGYVRFAEVKEVEPPVPTFPALPAAAAIPATTAATSPALVAAAAGALSMAAVSRIVLARSKKSVEVQA